MTDQKPTLDFDRIDRLQEQLRRAEESARQNFQRLKSKHDDTIELYRRARLWILLLSIALAVLAAFLLGVGVEHLQQKRSLASLMRSEFVPVDSPEGLIPTDGLDHLISVKALPRNASAVLCCFHVDASAIKDVERPIIYTITSRLNDHEFRYPVFSGAYNQNAHSVSTVYLWLPYPSDGNLNVRSSDKMPNANAQFRVKILGYR